VLSSFKVMNMAADFSSLETKSGNYMRFGHPRNLRARPIYFLWRLRHITGFFKAPPQISDFRAKAKLSRFHEVSLAPRPVDTLTPLSQLSQPL
jgi:hypothetical protein